jgi:hypothetical protein
MLKIEEAHFLSHPELLLQEMRRRRCSGRIELRDGSFIVLEWGIEEEAANDPVFLTN